MSNPIAVRTAAVPRPPSRPRAPPGHRPSDPRVEAFADQFGVDVSVIDDDLRRRFLEATGPTAFEVTQAIYVDDYWPRRVAAGARRRTWPAAEADEPAELWPLIEEFMREVARLDTLDPVTHRAGPAPRRPPARVPVCKSRRSVAAIDAGADEAIFDAVDDYADSDLPDRARPRWRSPTR